MRRALGAYTGFVLLVLYLPIAVMVLFSFNASNHFRWTGFSLHWYGRLWADHELREPLENTIILGLASTAVATVLGTLAALGARRAFPGKRLYHALVALPVMVPDIVLGIGLFMLFHTAGIGLSLATATVAHATFNLAYVAIVVSARLQGLDRSLELAAQDLGATPWGAFWRITFPAILPGILSGALLAFTLSFDDFVVTYFTAGTGNKTLPWRIYGLVAGKGRLTPEINAVSTLILAASLALIVAALRLARVPVTGGRK